MSKPELRKVLELLITEESEQASKLLHEWFVVESRSILEDLMHDDDDVLDSIKTDKQEIEAEEFYGDADLHEDEESDDDEEVDFEIEDDLDDEASDDLASELDVDTSVDDKIVDLENEVDDLKDKNEDTVTSLASLRAEFDALMGNSAEDLVSDEDDIVDAEDDFVDVEDELDFDKIDEAFELELVPDPNLEGDKEIGDGGKLKITDHSPLPNVDPKDRFGGDFVEVIGDSHKGYDIQKAPEVVKAPIMKNMVRNAKEDLEPVKVDVKGALLSKKIEADKGKSPIGGGAVDLRGSDTKRKK